MRTHTTRRRSAARMLSLAAVAGLGLYHNTDPANPQGGGGAPSPAPAKPAGNDPEKLTLTKAELDAQIAAALDADRKKAEDKAKRDKDEADRKAAEQQGKYKELLDAETARTAELSAENRTLKVSLALGEHLADKHPDYVKSAKYIIPLVPGDTPDDNLAKAVEDAAAQFVKDNPRQAKGTGAPPVPPTTGNRTNIPAAPAAPANGHRPRFSTLRSNI